MKKFIKVKVVDDGEIYILPDDKAAKNNTPSFVREDEFPSIRVTDDDYNANTMIAKLNEQLDKKEKELKKATKSVITVDKSAVIAGSATLGIILSLVIIFLFTLNNNTTVSETEHIVYEQPKVSTQVEQEESKEYTEEIIYVQEEENKSEDEKESTEQTEQVEKVEQSATIFMLSKGAALFIPIGLTFVCLKIGIEILRKI